MIKVIYLVVLVVFFSAKVSFSDEILMVNIDHLPGYEIKKLYHYYCHNEMGTNPNSYNKTGKDFLGENMEKLINAQGKYFWESIEKEYSMANAVIGIDHKISYSYTPWEGAKVINNISGVLFYVVTTCGTPVYAEKLSTPKKEVSSIKDISPFDQAIKAEDDCKKGDNVACKKYDQLMKDFRKGFSIMAEKKERNEKKYLEELRKKCDAGVKGSCSEYRKARLKSRNK